jgi:hypothetical protein
MEQTLMFSPAGEEEHSTEMLKIFSQEAEQEMTVALKPAAEEEVDIMYFVDMYKELEALERRVMVQSLHIRQAKLEEGSGAYQPQEKLEEVGIQPAQGEMVEVKMSEEKVGQQLSEKTVELNFAEGWQVEATEEEDSLGDRDDLPICREEVQRSRLQKESQPWEKLDEIIEEIRRLMIRSIEAVNKGKLNNKGLAIAAE